ncbi:hypothetical protein ACWC3Y_11150 [Streptomyces sp. NPDC001296]
MNALTVFLIVLAVIAVAVPVLWWQIFRALRNEVAEATAAEAPRPAPPVIDTEPGFNLALRDECELIWAARTPSGLGLDELRALIRDEQQRGEQA